MTPFIRLETIAAPLPIANIDTDKILPARFLTTVNRKGLGDGLFHTLKNDPEFVLNREPWNKAGILIALDNFGCGSSREHAPWALLDFGIRCIIAPSFADIFYNNCLKNGMLPIVLSRADVDEIIASVLADITLRITVDLEAQSVQLGDHRIFHFAIDARHKDDLRGGVDEIATSLQQETQIAGYEIGRYDREHWLRRTAISQYAIDRIICNRPKTVDQ